MEKGKSPRRGGWIALSVVLVLALAFFTPAVGMKLSPSVWYPYSLSPSGYVSVTYKFLGSGAVYWGPNHYWVYLGSSTWQIVNSSASSLTVKSVDQNGTAIFGYYTVLSNPGGAILKTGYSTVTFPTIAGQKYGVQVEGYGKCVFSHWSTGSPTTELSIVARSGDYVFTAVYSC